jgi:hypothetical protein
MGGLDLCFGRCIAPNSSLTSADCFPLGRWDTPQHALVDDPEEGEETIWPGAYELNNNPSMDTVLMTWQERTIVMLGSPIFTRSQNLKRICMIDQRLHGCHGIVFPCDVLARLEV